MPFDAEPLKYQASQAENRGDLLLAKQMWKRVLALPGVDEDAWEAIERIAQKQGQFSTTQSTSKSPTSSTGGRGQAIETAAQREAKHQQNLTQYQQKFSQAVEREFPLSKGNRRQLITIQKSLQLTNQEVSQIEQPIVAPKETQRRQQQEQERIRQQREAERQRQQREAERQQKREAQKRKQKQLFEKWRQLFTSITTQTPISRRRFLQWTGLGGGGLVITLVTREMFKGSLVAEPKYIPPTEGALWTVKFETITVDAKGEVVKRDSNKQAKFFKEDLGNNVTLEMVSIPDGYFKMGSPSGEGYDEEKPQHEVTVPAFFMGRYQVTQEQYQKVMGKNPSRFKGDKRPVEGICWNDAVEFCKKLSQKTGLTYRLPSEAEWEYACRAGTTTPFHFGKTITTNLVNYDGNYAYAYAPKGKFRQETTEVGQFPPNAFGLYDMHGNVWEWCQDTWHDNYNGAPNDGSAWIDNDNHDRLVRGGSWSTFTSECRSARRNRTYPTLDNNDVGLRVVCMVAPRSKK